MVIVTRRIFRFHDMVTFTISNPPSSSLTIVSPPRWWKDRFNRVRSNQPLQELPPVKIWYHKPRGTSSSNCNNIPERFTVRGFVPIVTVHTSPARCNDLPAPSNNNDNIGAFDACGSKTRISQNPFGTDPRFQTSANGNLSRLFVFYEFDWTETEHMDQTGERNAVFRPVIIKTAKFHFRFVPPVSDNESSPFLRVNCLSGTL